jgi:hypothetical protein
MISLDETYRGLVRVYQEKRPLIEKALFEELQMADLPTEYVPEANYFFGNGLTAALELGDPAFLEADLEWVQRLLTGRRISSERLIPYLAIYSHALHISGMASIPITDWILYMVRDETANREFAHTNFQWNLPRSLLWLKIDYEINFTSYRFRDSSSRFKKFYPRKVSPGGHAGFVRQDEEVFSNSPTGV